MKNNYISILNSVLKYEKTELEIISVIFVIFIAIFSFIVFSKRHKLSKSNMFHVYFCITAVCIVFLLCIVYYVNNTSKIKTDIENTNFKEYEGYMIHDDYQKDSFYRTITVFENDSKITLSFPDCDNWYDSHKNYKNIPFGECYGKLIYAENSKIIVDWEIFEQ